MRRRGFAAVSLLCALSLAASGCAAEEKPTAADQIRVGVNVELSGVGSALGESYKNGLETIIDDINKKGVLGNHEIKLLYRDNKSDPAEGIRVAKNLWDNQNVVAMIGPGVSPVGVPVSVEANKRKIPMIAMASSTAITRPAAERPYTYKTSPDNDAMAELQVEHLKKLKVKKVAYIAANNAYGQISQKAFEAAAKKAGMEIVANELYNDQDKDYTSHITKMLAQQPEAIAAAAINPQSTILAKNIKAAKFKGPVIFEAGAGAELFLKDVGNASDGMYMVNMSIMAANHIQATTPAHWGRRSSSRRTPASTASTPASRPTRRTRCGSTSPRSRRPRAPTRRRSTRRSATCSRTVWVAGSNSGRTTTADSRRSR
jgi:ABC-type branched-chain amino acid transport systems, periplasmic component